MEMRKIVVCDDDPQTLDALAELLSNAGYAVSTAASHTEMLDKFDTAHPDLLILDVRLPEHDGMWIAESLLSHGRNIPIIFHTGCDAPSYRLYAPFVGASAYLTKPCDSAVLLEKIEEALRPLSAAVG